MNRSTETRCMGGLLMVCAWGISVATLPLHAIQAALLAWVLLVGFALGAHMTGFAEWLVRASERLERDEDDDERPYL
jgi:cation transporter-like permease